MSNSIDRLMKSDEVKNIDLSTDYIFEPNPSKRNEMSYKMENYVRMKCDEAAEFGQSVREAEITARKMINKHIGRGLTNLAEIYKSTSPLHPSSSTFETHLRILVVELGLTSNAHEMMVGLRADRKVTLRQKYEAGQPNYKL